MIDTDLMTKIKDRARQLMADNAKRDERYKAYEDMYLLRWREQQSGALKHMRLTADPGPRNSVRGAVQLMVATEPKFGVPDWVKAESKDKIETHIQRWWYQGGRQAQSPIEHDLVTQGVLYGEMHAAITPTFELLEYYRKALAQANANGLTAYEKAYLNANIRRAERVAQRTPFLVEAWNPRTGYPEDDTLGMSAYYRCTRSTVAMVESKYGVLPEGLRNKNRSDTVTLHHWHDLVYSACWTDEGDIYLDEHKYPTIPVMVQVVDGSKIFEDIEDRSQPMLYTLLKSGLWDSQNLALTVIYTTVFAMGWPKFIYTPGQSGATFNLNWEDEVIELNPGDQFAPLLNKGLIDPNLQAAYQLAVQKVSESTIHPTALGAPPTGNTTFSELSLLSQSGRLPLVGTQKRGGWGMAGAAETMLLLAKENPEYLRGTDLVAADIPDNIQMECSLEVRLPHEKLQLANLAQQLKNIGISDEWIQTNVLGIGQPDTMRRQRWDEQASEIMYQQQVQQLIQSNQQRQQMGGQQQPPQEMQAGPMMAPGQAQQMRGIPPQMAGMVPGASQAAVPPQDDGGMNG